MKEIICGINCNTKTAERIRTWETSAQLSESVFGFGLMSLYGTKNGQFFMFQKEAICGEWPWGNDYSAANVRYHRGKDSQIVLLDPKCVLLWLEERKTDPDCPCHFIVIGQ